MLSRNQTGRASALNEPTSHRISMSSVRRLIARWRTARYLPVRLFLAHASPSVSRGVCSAVGVRSRSQPKLSPSSARRLRSAGRVFMKLWAGLFAGCSRLQNDFRTAHARTALPLALLFAPLMSSRKYQLRRVVRMMALGRSDYAPSLGQDSSRQLIHRACARIPPHSTAAFSSLTIVERNRREQAYS
ncbi:hypothetical protein FA95DRAFT_802159 [Auriscalpium vulgare]|uniref:Uncharacterized protein n=1 Tax=Auriscalpium vulgare TaxID=40419 RepID=A0ACB8RZR7_9AGAM|nr:hypothetical protein FA95DRAFT_802159 [Auriscalpium vulgare]